LRFNTYLLWRLRGYSHVSKSFFTVFLYKKKSLFTMKNRDNTWVTLTNHNVTSEHRNQKILWKRKKKDTCDIVVGQCYNVTNHNPRATRKVEAENTSFSLYMRQHRLSKWSSMSVHRINKHRLGKWSSINHWEYFFSVVLFFWS